MGAIPKALLGGFMLVCGLVSIVGSLWAYSVTNDAFQSVRRFSGVLTQERGRATEALRGLTDAFGESGAVGPVGSVGERGLDVRDTVRSVLGIAGGGTRDAPAAPKPGAASTSDNPLRSVLDPLQGRVQQLSAGWNALADGPLSPSALDRFELATKILIGWMAAYGLGSVVAGIILLRGDRATPPAAASSAGWRRDADSTQPIHLSRER